VVGFDLAGAERGFPATAHRRAIDVARTAGLGLTLHAGEADSGQRVLEAIALGATRIGHGVQIAVNDAPGRHGQASHRMAQVAAMRVQGQPVHFEVCPTSNVHTGACPDLPSHPLPAMLAAGLEVSVHTDNRLMSGVTHSQELANAQRLLGWTWQDAARSMQSAAKASFLPLAERQAALEKINAWARTLG
jgi:adenosine deaminase